MSFNLTRAVREAAAPLSPSERLVLWTLASYATAGEVTMFGSLSTLAKKTGLTRQTVRAVLKRLLRDGILSVVEPPRPRRAARYQINATALARGATITPLNSPETGVITMPQRVTDDPSEGSPAPLRGVAVTPDLVTDLVIEQVPDLAVYAAIAREAFRAVGWTPIGTLTMQFQTICKRRGVTYDDPRAQRAIEDELMAQARPDAQGGAR